MQLLSWGLTFFVIYAPMLLSLVLLVAAGILYSRVKSRSTAAFFFGMLVVSLAPWAMWLNTAGTHNRGFENIRLLVTTFATIVQSFGLLFYALSIPKRAQEN